MPAYPRLQGLIDGMMGAARSDSLEQRVVPYLVEVWLEDYHRRSKTSEVVTVALDGFTYLFDVLHERLIAAWGSSRGRHASPRDKGRMAGHPRAGGNLYHRGHAIPHTLGGPTDINLVPQLGRVNIGQFRVLERRAVGTPGAVYFTYWAYRVPQDQIPYRVEQGLLRPGQPAEIRRHTN